MEAEVLTLTPRSIVRRDIGLMIKGMKLMLEAPLKKCGGGKGVCKRAMDDGKGAMSKCSR